MAPQYLQKNLVLTGNRLSMLMDVNSKRYTFSNLYEIITSIFLITSNKIIFIRRFMT